jgi:CheY-like chemotaxis protein
MTSGPLNDRRILLVEDEYLLAAEMHADLVDAGAIIIGPAASLASALRLIAETDVIHGAVLDVNLGGQAVFPAAEILQARGVPMLFVSGYDPKIIPPQFMSTPHCENPVAVEKVIKTLVEAMQLN